jgi:tetratricopeptide (TPR) repeat protein
VRGELDWIVMKALEKDRNRRYETANGFAMDVQRYLADEQVQACPPSPLYRLKKFVRRNKGPVLAAALVMLALLVGMLGTAWQAVRADRERTRVSGALKQAEANYQDARTQEGIARTNLSKAQAQARRAEENFQKVLAAVDQWLKPAISEETPLTIKEELYKIPEVVALMSVPLDRALKFFEDFIEQKGSDPETRLERAWAYLQVGRIHQRMAELPETKGGPSRLERRKVHSGKEEEAYRKSIALLEALVAEPASDARFRVEEAKACRALAEVLERQANIRRIEKDPSVEQRVKEAESALRRVLGIYTQLSGEQPDEREYRYQRALAYKQLGALLADHKVTAPDEWKTTQYEGIAILKQLIAEHPDEAPFALGLAEAYLQLSSELRIWTKRPEEAASCHQLALTVLEKAVANFPNEPRCFELLAGCYSRLGYEFGVAKRNIEAKDAYRRSVAIWEKRAAISSMSYQEQAKSFQTYETLASHLKIMGQREEAAWHYARQVRMIQAALAKFPNQISFTMWSESVARALEELGRPQTAEVALRLATAEYEKLFSNQPSVGGFGYRLAIAKNNLGTLLMQTGRFQLAETEYTQAIHLFETIPNTPSPENPSRLFELSNSWSNLGVLLVKTGRSEEALKAFRQAISSVQRTRTEVKTDTDFYKQVFEKRSQSMYSDRMALYQKRVGDAARDTKKYEEAEKAYRESMTILQKELSQDRNSAEQLADLQSRLAEVLLKAGQDEQAEKTLRDAANAWQKLGADSFRQNELAIVYYRLSLLLEKAGRQEEAQEVQRQLAKLSSNTAIAHNQSAWLRASSRVARWYRDPTRAVELVQKAIELMPESGDLWNTLGVANYRTGNWQAAVEAHQMAREFRKGGDSSDFFFLAMAHWQLGKKEEAHRWYDRAVEWMEKNGGRLSRDDAEEMRDFRTEAAALIGIPETWPESIDRQK